MDDARARRRLKTVSEIKKEQEDEEMHEYVPCKTTNTRAQRQESASMSNDNDDHCGSNSAITVRRERGRPKKVKEQEEEVEVTPNKRIKTESEEEERSDEDHYDSDSDYYDSDDSCYSDVAGADLCKQRNVDVNGSTDGEGLSWEFRSAPDTKPTPFRFRPARTPGPSLDTTATWTPLSVFQLFCSMSVIRTIVDNTNKNGARQRPASGKKKWTPITIKEFYIFLTAVMYTSLVKLHDSCDYWKKIWLYELQFPRNYISRDRFKDIRTTLLLCDPEKDEENESKRETPEYDKLFKVQPFYNEIVTACKALFQPHQNLCVHERKVKKNKKPLKCGYRLFALADSLTGYTWNLYFHTGRTAATRGQTAGYTAVKNLLPLSTIGSGYKLYTDGPFSSPRLFTELFDKNIGCCGILSKHHPEFPKNAHKDFPAPRASRGDIRWLRKDKLLFVKWMDTREVAMCSTVHEAFTGQVLKRPVKQGNGWILKQFSCPDAVADFNRHMIVLKDSDFDFSHNMPCTRVDWHRILFYNLLDVAVVNSSILYNEMLKVKGDSETKQLTEKEFREELCKEMLKFAHGCEPVPKAESTAGPSTVCMPLYFVEGSAAVGRSKCRWCTRSTPIYCQKCLVALCLTCNRNCYKEWHEAQ